MIALNLSIKKEWIENEISIKLAGEKSCTGEIFLVIETSRRVLGQKILYQKALDIHEFFDNKSKDAIINEVINEMVEQLQEELNNE